VSVFKAFGGIFRYAFCYHGKEVVVVYWDERAGRWREKETGKFCFVRV
jgi:hypothetical protein